MDVTNLISDITTKTISLLNANRILHGEEIIKLLKSNSVRIIFRMGVTNTNSNKPEDRDDYVLSKLVFKSRTFKDGEVPKLTRYNIVINIAKLIDDLRESKANVDIRDLAIDLMRILAHEYNHIQIAVAQDLKIGNKFEGGDYDKYINGRPLNLYEVRERMDIDKLISDAKNLNDAIIGKLFIAVRTFLTDSMYRNGDRHTALSCTFKVNRMITYYINNKIAMKYDSDKFEREEMEAIACLIKPATDCSQTCDNCAYYTKNIENDDGYCCHPCNRFRYTKDRFMKIKYPNEYHQVCDWYITDVAYEYLHDARTCSASCPGADECDHVCNKNKTPSNDDISYGYLLEN